MDYYPRTIDWELTSKLTRPQNDGKSRISPHSELTLDSALSVAAQLPSLGVERVNLVGDEPLLYPHWYGTALSLKYKQIHTELLTYGPIRDDETPEMIRESGINRVVFGLDGLAANHDRIHKRPELFKSILHGIEKVMAVDLPVTIVTMVTDSNIGELPTMLYVIHAAGATRWKLQALISSSPWHHPNGTRLCDDTFGRLNTLLGIINPQAEKLGITIELGNSLGYYTDGDIRREPWSGCPGGKFSCAITSSGRVKGCLFLPDEMTEGDLHQRPLRDIWHDPKSFSYARVSQGDDMGPNCEDCEYSPQCHGGCSAMSMVLTGKLHNDPYCFRGLERRG